MYRLAFARGIAAVAAIGLLTGQSSPAPSAPALPSKPLRQLEYAFSVDYQRNGEGNVGAIGTAGSGVVSLMAGRGRQGVLDVDVLAVAKDGGLVVRADEWLQAQPRATQAFTCAVYPDGRVICPESLAVTDAENEIMSYLGRGFFDPSLVDGHGHWQRSYSNKYVTVTSDFTLRGSAGDRPLAIDEKATVVPLAGPYASWNDAANLSYDPSLEVPLMLHDVAVQVARGHSSVQTTMDFRLTKDSFAKPH